MGNPGCRQLVLLAILVATPSGCGELQREALPYRYRQWLLDPPAPGERPDSPRVRRRADRRGRRSVASASAITRRCQRVSGRPFASDAALAAAILGREVSLSAPTLRRDRPRAGELVFFDSTADPNKNQRPDDRRTRAGVVCSVSQQRVRFAYRLDGRARLGVLQLRLRHRRRASDGTILNTYLRRRQPRDPSSTRYLAGELLAGFATP